MTAEQSLEVIRRERMVMVLRAPTPETALAGARAAIDAGIRVVEVTFTVPGAVDVIAELSRSSPDDGTLIGAGTVRTTEQADAAISAGARFVVSPGLDEPLVARVTGQDVLALPGILSPSEAMRALAAGARALKLFPASAVDPGYIGALLGPMPELEIVPSGGVGPGNARAWLDAGAVAVGMGGALSPSGPLDQAGLEAIHEAARQSLVAVRTPSATPDPSTKERP
ncbi:bifunctional 4-hydroxy-2-oxoglutarate aldolase/2-dehydro-3-deoxy-phosphogluconate aldolase [Blastococcus saxobsidens]|uniref:2-dehydro-3-deoxyphosphogluconate aldolase/(4S)-4-hydroxy-2-oxoglutarate aldolase n=1 Tax=Blastococcus saxobsidens TaxID=138336 RepID=A0A4Q7Y6B7_9ACTN|nr:bifunctional 4-hydroxy-2-oxoglutarate aldolase/2-dehydro-3-deoxy-phosphogluconate aldolase [Blastococcus saxobsidens]RZU32208.1 2-dehydro-3-deoxyphosphogluconate aldolase/(4S)-4-hydroxy-2-oxoglutarate aldolase [Blastococcus saxobsidens]